MAEGGILCSATGVVGALMECLGGKMLEFGGIFGNGLGSSTGIGFSKGSTGFLLLLSPLDILPFLESVKRR